MNPGEKTEAPEWKKQSRFLSWLDNFWYHYKWGVIAAAFFLTVFLICFIQCGTREKNDLTVTCAGGYTFSEEERQNLRILFSNYAPDLDGNGEKAVAVNDYSIYTEEELKALYTDEDGDFSQYGYAAAKEHNTDRINTLSTYLKTGECGVYFVSEYVYQTMNLQKIAAPLSELFESAPASSYDGYAVRLRDTDLYQYYGVLQILPEDTLIVLSEDFVWGATNNQTIYSAYRDLFCSFVNFRKPD